MVCDEEFARRVGVIIGFYVKRISEGMGKDSSIGWTREGVTRPSSR
jgi:hypothetical protein